MTEIMVAVDRPEGPPKVLLWQGHGLPTVGDFVRHFPDAIYFEVTLEMA